MISRLLLNSPPWSLVGILGSLTLTKMFVKYDYKESIAMIAKKQSLFTLNKDLATPTAHFEGNGIVFVK